MNKRYKTIRRVIITGPRDEGEDALKWLWNNGYRTTRVGPVRTSYAKYDITRFKAIGEKEIDSV